MAEETTQPTQPTMSVLAQYIRDMSFENILAQYLSEVFRLYTNFGQ